MGRRIEAIPSEVMDALARYTWPGNVRELQNIIERAVILSPGPSLQVPLTDLQVGRQKPEVESPSPVSENGSTGDQFPTSNQSASTGMTLEDAERTHILGVLGETGWVVGGAKGAAARLGMKRSTLQWKMKKLGISRFG